MQCSALHRPLIALGCFLCPLLVCFLTVSDFVKAAQEYTPDHPVVQEMVEKGVQYLEKGASSTTGGEAVLSAIQRNGRSGAKCGNRVRKVDRRSNRIRLGHQQRRQPAHRIL